MLRWLNFFFTANFKNHVPAFPLLFLKEKVERIGAKSILQICKLLFAPFIQNPLPPFHFIYIKERRGGEGVVEEIMRMERGASLEAPPPFPTFDQL